MPLSFSILSSTAILVIIAGLAVMELIKHTVIFLRDSKKQVSRNTIGK